MLWKESFLDALSQKMSFFFFPFLSGLLFIYLFILTKCYIVRVRKLTPKLLTLMEAGKEEAEELAFGNVWEEHFSSRVIWQRCV